MDTTVILAQPRGSRLRADAVYVDRSGMVGHGLPSAEIYVYGQGEIFPGTPFSAPNLSLVHPKKSGQSAKKCCVLRSDLTPRILVLL